MTTYTHSHYETSLTDDARTNHCPADDCHSPMFALTGHNSELFHSNFLIYLAECHRDFFFDVMADIFEPATDSSLLH